VSGNVRVQGSGQRGLLTVTTVSGDAAVTRVAGEVNGNTVSGNFTVTAGETSRSRLRSTSGDLGMRGRLAADARLDFEIKLIPYDFARFGAAAERKRLLEKWDREVYALPR
jgi:DUF4097 and DUF4098 domain-containing protein YvlB